MDCGMDNNNVYSSAEQYWKSVPADVNGMLGGFSQLSQIDVHDSRRFLSSMIKKFGTKSNRALDCGSGIGRVTKYLLLPIFNCVDMVDVTEQFLQESSSYLGDALNDRVERKICSGLQDLTPEPGRYDAVWIQWVSGHLTDDDFVAFLKRSRLALGEKGLLFLKENVASSFVGVFDETDHSWTRPRNALISIFESAGLEIVDERLQKKFPKGIYQIGLESKSVLPDIYQTWFLRYGHIQQKDFTQNGIIGLYDDKSYWMAS